jgi:hypothetical protein
MVDKIIHISIILVLPTNSVLNIKNILYTTYIDLHGLYAPGTPGQLPGVPMR